MKVDTNTCNPMPTNSLFLSEICNLNITKTGLTPSVFKILTTDGVRQSHSFERDKLKTKGRRSPRISSSYKNIINFEVATDNV